MDCFCFCELSTPNDVKKKADEENWDSLSEKLVAQEVSLLSVCEKKSMSSDERSRTMCSAI